MNVPQVALATEHLSPHDLVTYFRCPHEMELAHAIRFSRLRGTAMAVRTPIEVVPLRYSPLVPPPIGRCRVYEGRMDVAPSDTLVYVDESERDLPVLFPPERVRIEPRFREHGGTLIDPDFGLSGRPDLVIQRGNGGLVPVEYKSTHLFVGYHESHGRTFDALQVIAECRLVHVAFGTRPTCGYVMYGDVAGDGQREGWVEIPYGDAEEIWLRSALEQIRTDPVRPPVPAERNCRGCEPNAEGHCRFAIARYEGTHAHLTAEAAGR